MKEYFFPKDFTWGVSTSSYQIEGAWNEDGKGASIWDVFCHKKGRVKNNDTGDLACDHYHRFKEDIQIIKNLNYPSYRFSISWSRIYPGGIGEINEKGLDFYNQLVDELLKNNITPCVTLYHWDLPSKLEEKGGWLDRDTSSYFAEYSETVARKLGDRVKFWITLNEPWIVMMPGYVLGVMAPGVVKPFKSMIVAHNLLLAHGLATHRLRNIYSDLKIGITNALSPIYSVDYRKDASHVLRAHALVNSLWIDPVLKGKYPSEIEDIVYEQNMKNMRPGDLKIISEKIDFMGINNYSRMITRSIPFPIYNFIPSKANYKDVMFTSMGWEIFPYGIYELLMMMKDEYNNIPIYITENGASFYEEPENGKINDFNRIDFLQKYLIEVHNAILQGCDVKGYYVWSLLDNMEWAEGYSKTFGLIYIDRKNDLKRIPKLSAHWYSKVCKQNGFML